MRRDRGGGNDGPAPRIADKWRGRRNRKYADPMPESTRKRTPMSNEHKAALAEGRIRGEPSAVTSKRSKPTSPGGP